MNLSREEMRAKLVEVLGPLVPDQSTLAIEREGEIEAWVDFAMTYAELMWGFSDIKNPRGLMSSGGKP